MRLCSLQTADQYLHHFDGCEWLHTDCNLVVIRALQSHRCVMYVGHTAVGFDRKSWSYFREVTNMVVSGCRSSGTSRRLS